MTSPFDLRIIVIFAIMKYSNYLSCFILISALFFSACKKDEFLTDSSAKLEFSTDSVLFDTVFTTLGSTTKTFRIYNTHSQAMNISRIYLAGGSTSPFKLNVDGISGKNIPDVEIAGGDSLFVFVQVTVDPTGVSNPLLIKDSIIFETNNNIQDVKLTAVGQDVYLHKPDHFPLTGFPAYSIINCNDVWTNDKPHLIFGYAVVDSGCTLTMQPGTRVHLYKNAGLLVFKDGTLIVNGTKNNEVTFQGTRLEPDYKDIPGQWGQIWLYAGSKNNVINYAIIKNAGIGIRVDTVVTPGVPTLRLSNTIIKNMTAAAVYGLGAHIRSYNCVFANSGQYVAALTIGGKYTFEHCTFANFWSGTTTRTTPLLVINNYYTSGSFVILRPIDSCLFKNCILYGDLPDEIGLDSTTLAPYPPSYINYQFDHCLLKTTKSITNSHYISCYKNLNPGFVNASAGDYQLESTAVNSFDKGTTPSVLIDLNGNFRSGFNPDLGAYEFQ
ncbi:MAG: hypothetical protein JWO09_497 [Bacteroidetes bacterium]|nr:hypothetical protein [Bacteroidota bacterium]